MGQWKKQQNSFQPLAKNAKQNRQNENYPSTCQQRFRIIPSTHAGCQSRRGRECQLPSASARHGGQSGSNTGTLLDETLAQQRAGNKQKRGAACADWPWSCEMSEPHTGVRRIGRTARKWTARMAKIKYFGSFWHLCTAVHKVCSVFPGLKICLYAHKRPDNIRKEKKTANKRYI